MRAAWRKGQSTAQSLPRPPTHEVPQRRPIRTFGMETVVAAFASPPPPFPSPPPVFEQVLDEDIFLQAAAVLVGSLLAAVAAVHIFLAWKREMRLLAERDATEESIASNEKQAGREQLSRLERMLNVRREVSEITLGGGESAHCHAARGLCARSQVECVRAI